MISEQKFLKAAIDGNIKIIKQYIKEGGDVNINTKNDYNYTALMIASGSGYLEVVKCLIEANVDFDIKDNNGWTALMYALQYSHTEVVKVLENPNEYLLRKKLDIENASDVIKDSCIF